MNGLFEAGGVIGTLMLPVVADRWGRKWGCAVVGYTKWIIPLARVLANFTQSAIVALIGGALMTGSVNVPCLLCPVSLPALVHL
jgi:hypothetical protein